ncbi:outer membrane efflux protein [Bordetella ansorpii]|uniref:Outer membrane efflux protein n=1 Tax=Bordetella ansorpii TaxID=288768 RepID=A0A157KIU8_9BORD|nr:efflux transporter outer membrane subunit [Bordetella ansorpii]SAH84458.1 outer membrane efflux protein [Bordetella ansorpii]
MIFPSRHHSTLLTLPLAAALLAGCSVGPDFQPPAPALQAVQLAPRPDALHAQAAVSPDAVPRRWWTLFGDPVLDRLLAGVWDTNLDLQAASARLAQSRARYGVAVAGLYPRVDAGGSYARQRLSEYGPMAALGAPTDPTDLWQTGFDAHWEIDLWNRQGRLNEAALARMQAQVYQREAVRVTLAAEIARNYLVLRGVQQRLDIARQNEALAQHMVQLVQTRQRNGVATRFDLAAAQAQLAKVQALAPELSQRQHALMNALALSSGQAPRQLDALLAPTGTMPRAPDHVGVGLPSELAHRRPDILEAEAALHAATADIGAAQADFYPRITLGGSFGLQSLDDDNLGHWGARNFAIGPSIHLPIFEGGRLTRTLELTRASQQAAAIHYRKTVLQAWHEIDNALNARGAQYQQHDALAKAYEHSREAFAATQSQYRNGVADYVGVLVAQQALLRDQLALSDSTTAVGTSLVALYKALGGGWDPGLGPDPEAAAAASGHGAEPADALHAPVRSQTSATRGQPSAS